MRATERGREGGRAIEREPCIERAIERKSQKTIENESHRAIERENHRERTSYCSWYSENPHPQQYTLYVPAEEQACCGECGVLCDGDLIRGAVQVHE